MKNKSTKTLIKFIACLSLLAMTLHYFPARFTRAQLVVSDPGNQVVNTQSSVSNVATQAAKVQELAKEFKLDKIFLRLAQKASDRMTRSVIAWANNGFEGNPLYVNWESMFYEAAEDESKYFIYFLGEKRRRNQLEAQAEALLQQEIEAESAAELEALIAQEEANLSPEERIERAEQRRIAAEKAAKEPDDRSTIISLVEDFNSTYNDVINYTLDDVVGNDWRSYMLGQQGDYQWTWDNWEALTRPANNSLGRYFLMKNEIDRRIDSELTKRAQEVQAGNGFQNQKVCKRSVTLPDNNEFNPSRYCVEYDTITPGSLVRGLLTNSVGKSQDQLDNIDELGELGLVSLMRITDGLVNVGLKQLRTTAANQILSVRDRRQGGTIDVSQVIDGYNSDGSYNVPGYDNVIDLNTILNGTEDVYDDDGELVQAGKESVISKLETITSNLETKIELQRDYPEKLLSLDHCLPGPDLNYEQRLRDEFYRAAKTLQRKANTGREAHDDEAEAFDNLEEALDIFIQDLKIATYSNSEAKIKSDRDIRNLIAQVTEFTYQMDNDINELLRYEGLLSDLLNMRQEYNTWDESPPSPEDQAKLIQRYNVIQEDIEVLSDNSFDLDAGLAKTELTVERMDTLTVTCQVERQTNNITTNSEIKEYCEDVFTDKTYILLLSPDATYQEYKGIRCNDFYKSKVSDYFSPI